RARARRWVRVAICVGGLGCASAPPTFEGSRGFDSGRNNEVVFPDVGGTTGGPGASGSGGQAQRVMVEDIPCSAGAQSFLPALEARVLHRVKLPLGLVPMPVAAGGRFGGTQVRVVMEIDGRGTIRRSAVAGSSGMSELDRAVQVAIDEAGCMPVPPKSLLQTPSGTFKVSLRYAFRRG
ncbi:MAG TPA: TonB family protein, partial [Polyangia bacterium]